MILLVCIFHGACTFYSLFSAFVFVCWVKGVEVGVGGWEGLQYGPCASFVGRSFWGYNGIIRHVQQLES